MQRSSWWRDTWMLYLHYLVAVVATLPIACLYAYLAIHGKSGLWIEIALVAIGLVFSAFVWKRTERIFAAPQAIRQPVSISGLGEGDLPRPGKNNWMTGVR